MNELIPKHPHENDNLTVSTRTPPSLSVSATVPNETVGQCPSISQTVQLDSAGVPNETAALCPRVPNGTTGRCPNVVQL